VSGGRVPWPPPADDPDVEPQEPWDVDGPDEADSEEAVDTDEDYAP
jgi:hypothetical protein